MLNKNTNHTNEIYAVVLQRLFDVILLVSLVLAPFFTIVARVEYFLFFHWVVLFLILAVVFILAGLSIRRKIRQVQRESSAAHPPGIFLKGIAWFFTAIFFLSLLLVPSTIYISFQVGGPEAFAGFFGALFLLSISGATGIVSESLNRKIQQRHLYQFKSKLLYILYRIPALLAIFSWVYLSLGSTPW